MIQSVDTQVLIEIAQMYYEKNMTQQQIAKKVNMSRSLISKYLAKARSVGIVEIMIHSESLHPYRETEERLRQLFGLKHVKVCGLSDENQFQELCNEANRYLAIRFPSCKNIGISASRTVRAVADTWNISNSFPELTFVPISGGLGEIVWDNSANINTAIMGQKNGAKHQQLYSPIILDSIETKNLLCGQPFIKNVLDRARNSDMAILGIGASHHRLDIEETYLRDICMNYEMNDNLVAGELAFNYFDKNGKSIDCKWNNLLMGLSIEELKEIPERLVIANEVEKAESLYVALKNQLVNSIIVSAPIAKKLLLYHNKYMY